MRQRELITLLGGAAVAWPLAARTQQVARIGFLRYASPHEKQFNAFRDGLRALGYLEAETAHPAQTRRDRGFRIFKFLNQRP